MTPLLSIIVPVYNKAKFIDFCIQSILNQTLTDFELILINDGSTDDSGKKCDGFAETDTRVTVIHQRNQGVHAARNAGLQVASGVYIGFVDSDDVLDHTMYDVLVSNAIKHLADISMCGVRRVFPDKTQLFGGNGLTKLYNKDEGVTGLLNGEILLSNYDKIYKRKTVNDIRFEPALFEDTLYNFEALKASKISVCDDKILYNYMIRDNSHSMDAFNQKYMNTLILTKKMLAICEAEMPGHIQEAKAFDFNTNMIVLNMILIESRRKHILDYQIVADNLSEYSSFYWSAKGIQARYRYGYALFRLSPDLYISVLKMYSFYTNSEHLNRKKKLVNQPSNLNAITV
jgi:glycosyltransferase involved in cell wall biosynthesis